MSFVRLLLAAVMVASSVGGLGCASEPTEEMDSSDDELRRKVISQDEDSIRLETPTPIRVRLEADANSRWELVMDGGLGEPKLSVARNWYSFDWKKSALKDDTLYLPGFVKLDNVTDEMLDSFEPIILVGNPKAPGGVALDESIEGQMAQVEQGDLLVLALPQGASNGYSWKVISQPESFPEAEEEYTADNPERAGGTGSVTFLWTTANVEAGVYDIELALSRGPQTPIRTFAFQVEILER